MAEAPINVPTSTPSQEMGSAFETYGKTLGKGIEDLDYLNNRQDETREFMRFRKPILDPLIVGYNYLFITAPDLPIDPMAAGLQGNAQSAKIILDQNLRILEISGSTMYTNEMIKWLAGTHGDHFIPILTNRAVSYVASDEVLNTMDYAETWNKYKIVLGTTAKDSRVSGQLTIQFQEDQWLVICKLHKLWTNYIEKAFIGECISGGVMLSGDMMSNQDRTIDYMSSMYMFSTLPDGETLTHWSKYTGMFPLKGPWSEFTSEDGKAEVKQSIGIDYQFTYKESMKLHILKDFNLLQSFASLNDVKGSHYEGSIVDLAKVPTNPNRPYIARVTSDDRHVEGKNLFKIVFPD